MGMFDYIICEQELPGNPPDNLSFQSKSLGCLMETYTITKGGRLLMKRIKQVMLREGEVPHYKKFWGMTWYVEKPPMRMVYLSRPPLDMDYHGDIIFYDYVSGGLWYEYKARFTNGQLEWIREIDGQA